MLCGGRCGASQFHRWRLSGAYKLIATFLKRERCLHSPWLARILVWHRSLPRGFLKTHPYDILPQGKMLDWKTSDHFSNKTVGELHALKNSSLCMASWLHSDLNLSTEGEPAECYLLGPVCALLYYLDWTAVIGSSNHLFVCLKGKTGEGSSLV